MMKEIVCLRCGLPNRFRPFLIRRGDVWTLAAKCRVCLKFKKPLRRFMDCNFPDIREKILNAGRTREKGAFKVRLTGVLKS